MNASSHIQGNRYPKRNDKKHISSLLMSDFFPVSSLAASNCTKKNRTVPLKDDDSKGEPCMSSKYSASTFLSLQKSRHPHSKASRHQKQKKRRNPDAEFNPRSQLSKFKRSLLDKRKTVFDSLESQLKMEKNVSLDNNTESGSSWSSVDSSTGVPMNDHFATLRSLRKSVTKAEEAFISLHKAWRRKERPEIGRQLRRVRKFKRHVSSVMLPISHLPTRQAQLTPISVVESDQMKSPSIPIDDQKDIPNFLNFYPSLGQMGVGRHPLARFVDQRSGKHPKRLDDAGLAQLTDSLAADRLVNVSILNKPNQRRVVHHVGAHCANIMTDELDDLVFTILQKQYSLQRRLKEEKPLQFKSRRLYSTGLRETLKALRAAAVVPSVTRASRRPIVIFAADMEVTTEAESTYSNENDKAVDTNKDCVGNLANKRQTVQTLGMNGTLNEIRRLCAQQNVTTVTCMNRRRLAYALFAKGCNISVVHLHCADGVNDEVKLLRQYAVRLSEVYEDLLQNCSSFDLKNH